MLAKQGWRKLHHGTDLISRIFKAKYFPDGNFFNATLGHNLSYTWRSILSSRWLLQKGCRWRIGVGTQMHAWEDAWLPDVKDFHVQTEGNSVIGDICVADLMIFNSKEWDVELVQELFNERDASLIYKILPARDDEDLLIRHHSKKKTYIK
ncbi:hypothetical protein IHE45_18G047100 [Dioscorea alata]|uniref:Uncharacterized protein n=1 Tax=Dioscorea alata TaxID=55571 RepID=A0ACB7U6R4_DIOAL|nr:hypothetical protein IHE45_18G047100 [Dioscorea alata]